MYKPDTQRMNEKLVLGGEGILALYGVFFDRVIMY